jgi:hypothetical protein
MGSVLSLEKVVLCSWNDFLGRSACRQYTRDKCNARYQADSFAVIRDHWIPPCLDGWRLLRTLLSTHRSEGQVNIETNTVT